MTDRFDVAVLGGGPSGLAAVSYALYARLNVALVSPDLGGKVSYPFALRGMPEVDVVWGAALVWEFAERASSDLKHHFCDQATRVERRPDGWFTIELEVGEQILARTIIVCTGVRAQRLFVEGESHFWGKGLSYSAVSHAPLFVGRDVAVIGGGDRAIHATHILTNLARDIFYVDARPQHTTDAAAAERALNHPKVNVFRQWEVQQIVGDEFVTAIDLVGANGEVRRLPVEGVFVQFGLLPNNEAVRELVKLDAYGHIIVNEHAASSEPGIFAAGDVDSVHAEQVTVSLGEGAKAALSAWTYLASL